MQESIHLRGKVALLGCVAIAAITAGTIAGLCPAAAQESATETVVVTGTRFNTDAAPAKASLDTTEPQTIINKSYIENFLPPQSDYVTILAIVPSMTGGDINGPGLSDGGTKNTLRGFGDGMFNQTYDGIPFGDTNGPTHHNISYFPASAIGSIVVDRGPGNAGTLGAATFGGSVNFFSEGLTDDPHVRATGAFGSFSTYIEVLNLQSGDLNDWGVGHLRGMVNLQNLDSQGALSGQDVHTHNALIKLQDEIAPNWTVTLFGSGTFLKENLDDNNGATPAQVAAYGQNFALQDTNPNLPTYEPYNYTSKETDMDYLREDGKLLGVTIENTSYSYAYWNHTFSPNNQTQTAANIAADTSQGNASMYLANGTKDPNVILAYSKENAYRVYGDILRLSEDYDFGWLSGQIREGVWWETQATHRFKYFYDSITCTQDGIDPFDVGDEAANAACGVADKPFDEAANGSPLPAPASAATGGEPFSKAKSILNGALGYAKDDEHSDWTQYQPFLEVDLKPLDNLTITPGVKYVHWDHGVNAPVEQGNLCGVGAGTGNTTTCPNTPGEDFREGFITRDLLPFAEANYKIEPSWSVYAQYAKGIYVPDISTFENASPTAPNGFPTPELTTNYQVGTVFYADNFTFDADVYYIPVSNNIEAGICTFDASEECEFNTGTALYKGIEGEGTYALGDVFGFDLSGLSIFGNGALMSSKQGRGSTNPGNWEESAPNWTAAAGVLYNHENWKFSLIDKLVGSQYSDQANTPAYKLGSYADLFGSVGYTLGMFEANLTADNILDRRNTTLITINDTSIQPAATSLNQFFFQPPRSLMFALKVHY
jgi:iron complex outermembrane recepter protein